VHPNQYRKINKTTNINNIKLLFNYLKSFIY